MPIIDPQDARELDGHLQRFFDANPAERPHRLRQLFTEKFDFHPATGKVSLAKAPQNVTLPSDADRIASVEGIDVVYVPLQIPGTTRVRKAEAVEAARGIAREVGDDMLLLMTNEQAAGGATQLHVILPTFLGATPALRRMVIERDLPRRTVLQQLSNIYHQWQKKGDLRLALEEAFNVEAVTSAFFQQYREVFERVQGLVKGFPGMDDGREAKKLFVQTLFNRLMFIYFLSRKGWLKFKGDFDYLNALRREYPAMSEDKNFYKSRLEVLFFTGLNNYRSADLAKNNPAVHALIGDVPFLNGGLFDKTADEIRQADVVVPDGAIDLILHDLFDRFNFTVMESTPLDQEVAVDPEMLGKVFEELVTGRHETGSYYTPRPVVSFMCREALKGYVETKNTGASLEAIADFVDRKDTGKLTLATAPKIAETLAEVTVVDPACGSGAYLVGMMQELVELMTALYSAQLSHEAKDLYNLKLRIIEHSLYGVDIDPFAVNIAMLRLWLSLAIDYDSFPPPPLPNLDFKIVCGDSLLGPDPNPENYGTLFRHRVHELAGQLADLKDRHMRATGQEKSNLTASIEALRQQLREALAESAAPEGAVDWRVEFAEVFDQNGGFDVAIANPPYVRQEDIRDNKPTLRQLYVEAVTGMSDLYCYFFARAVQLLRKNGMHIFVSSNSWLDVAYGGKLQSYLLLNSHVIAIYESAVERQFSTAAINTLISIVRRETPDDAHETRFVSLRAPFPVAISDSGSRQEATRTRRDLWEDGVRETDISGRRVYEGDKWGGKYLRAPSIFHTILERSAGRFRKLGEFANVRRGFTSGANSFFYIDGQTQDRWQIEDEFLRPLLKGPRDVSAFRMQTTRLPYRVFVCSRSKQQLAGTNALRYIAWGERQVVEVRQGNARGTTLVGFHRLATLAGRSAWWDLSPPLETRLFLNKGINDRHFVVLMDEPTACDQQVYQVKLRIGEDEDLYAALMNSSLTALFAELNGRCNFGEGVLWLASYEVAQLRVLSRDSLSPHDQAALKEAFDKLASRRPLSFSDEITFEDRRALDDIVFDALELSSIERDAVYEAIAGLIRRRLQRAASV